MNSVVNKMSLLTLSWSYLKRKKGLSFEIEGVPFLLFDDVEMELHA